MQDKDVGTFKERNIYNFEKSTQWLVLFCLGLIYILVFMGYFCIISPDNLKEKSRLLSRFFVIV